MAVFFWFLSRIRSTSVCKDALTTRSERIILGIATETTMRYDMNNPNLEIEPVYGDVIITFKGSRLVDEELLSKIEEDIIQLGESQPGTHMTLDFKNVQFMSSAALGFLVKLKNSIDSGKGRLKLRNMSKKIYEVFKITNLNKLFTIEISK